MEKEPNNTVYEPRNSYQDHLDYASEAIDPFLDASGRDPANEYVRIEGYMAEDDADIDDQLLEEETDDMLDDDLRGCIEGREEDMEDTSEATAHWAA